MKDRIGNLLNSMPMIFRKTSKHNGSKTQDSSVLESRHRLEQRIELALRDMIEHETDHNILLDRLSSSIAPSV